MKPNATSKSFFDARQAAAALAAAPVKAPPDKANPSTDAKNWDKAIVSHSHEDLRSQLVQRRTRGPNKQPTKEQVTIRFDRDTLDALRATGPGWQTRVNEAAREWLARHGTR